MDLGKRLQHWWDIVRGYEAPTAQPAKHAAQKTAGPTGARSIHTVNADDPDGPLRFSVEGGPQGKASSGSRRRDAGFDPYESTGRYKKPRGWDDVHRK
jgi:hypothetical protein